MTAVIVGVLSSVAGAPEPVQAALVATSAGIPAAVAYHRQKMRIDPQEDIARIRNGELKRPIGLVVTLFTLAIMLADSIVGAVIGFIFGAAISGDPERAESAAALGTTLSIIGLLAMSAAAFAIASHASHYLGEKPYMWAGMAFAVNFIIRAIVITLLGVPLGPFFLLFYGAILAAMFAGIKYGQRTHQQFLMRKLARMQQHAGMQPPNHASTSGLGIFQPPTPNASAQSASAQSNATQRDRRSSTTGHAPPPNPAERRIN